MRRSTHTTDFYENRLAVAIEHIEDRLAEPLSIAELAEKAAFSLSHFRKIFTQWMGETPQEYLRRRRLERAASLIRYDPNLKIKDVSEECGYQSPEAFHRAFQMYFGMAPTEWRAGGYTRWNDEAEKLSVASPDIQDSQIQLKLIQRFRVVYQRKVGPYDEGEDAHELWSRFVGLAEPLNLDDQECYGMGLDDPSITPRARCRFDACVKLPPSVNPSHHVPVKTIGGGYYAMLPYRGPAGKTAEHWAWLCRSWLPKSGYKISLNPCFERYLGGFPIIGAEVRSELYLPVRK